MINTRTNSCFFFFKGKLKLQNHSSFSPAVSLYFSAIDHQNNGIMVALVKAPLSQCINISTYTGTELLHLSIVTVY